MNICSMLNRINNNAFIVLYKDLPLNTESMIIKFRNVYFILINKNCSDEKKYFISNEQINIIKNIKHIKKNSIVSIKTI